MIGVIAKPTEQVIVSEFFELFKTPWEFYQSGRQYEVLLCAGDGEVDQHSAKLVLIYAGRKVQFDTQDAVDAVCGQAETQTFSYKGTGLPIYGDSVTFREKKPVLLVDTKSKRAAAYLDQSDGRVLARIGYDLFCEIRTLLAVGQPTSNANIPALDLHIALLRDLIVASGVLLVEIPPVPQGYQFIACITHDVDHASIRRHKFDHTMFGFLYRAVLGSLRNLFQGRMPVRNLLTNWAAALKLPFVYMGFAKDFWGGFDDCYLELDKGLRSTFFVIPFKNYPGKNSHGLAPRFRAARYDARDIADTIAKITAAGCEVGLHGIDAWLDSSKGHEELEEIRRLTGVSEIGVRMHWLYYDQQSPITLEQAEAAYDATIGYNETVGYRAGTTQAYKPLQATRLLELPLHVMDTALFYPSHLGLSPKQATILLGRLGDNAVQFGGCLTINWHDRSLAPERLWGVCYRDLLQDLKNRGAWFATAGQAICWFRKRRSVVFETDCIEPDAVRARVCATEGDPLPGLRLRIHNTRESSRIGTQGFEGHVDMAFDECVDNRVPCGVSR
jgi:hypothetical protein